MTVCSNPIMANRRALSLFTPNLIYLSTIPQIPIAAFSSKPRTPEPLGQHSSTDCTEEFLHTILTHGNNTHKNPTRAHNIINWIDYENAQENNPPHLKFDAQKICSILDEEGILGEHSLTFDQRLAPFISRLSPDLVCMVIAHCRIVEVLPAVRFFLWAEQQPGYRHTSTTWDAILGLVATTHDYNLMAKLMKERKQGGFAFTPRTFSFVMDEGGGLRHEMLDGVIRLINRIHEWKRREKNHDAHDALISALCNANHLDSALEVLRRMLPGGFNPTTHTYNILISAFCREGRLEDARLLIQDMKDKGCAPNTITYNRLLKAYIQSSRLKDASELVDSMAQAGCIADAFTYTQLINVACRSRLPDMGLKLLQKMVYSGLKPMQTAYEAIIDSFHATGQFDEANKLVVEMEDRGYEKTAR